MKTIAKIAIVVLLVSPISQSKAQVLISLLFGDKLNSEKIEFGLEGGLNRSFFNDTPEANGLNNFNLGFYFHLLLKNDSYFSTGVMVKSNVGATGMPTYPVGDEDIDSVFEDGNLTTKASYFYVPALFHQRSSNRWYIEAGPMVGLRTKVRDIFDVTAQGGDLEYTRDVSDQFKRLDAGLMGGLGYKLKKQTKSMAIGVNYYYGLVNVSKQEDQKIRNSSIYLYVKIPIGAGKKKEAETN
jgi:hypothetical protein